MQPQRAKPPSRPPRHALQWRRWIIGLALAALGFWVAQQGIFDSRPDLAGGAQDTPTIQLPAGLPPEAGTTLQRIARGGPFPYRQDGGVFQNRERRLPMKPTGWYREYTVDTPGSRDRGARRIIAAGDPPVAYFYTDDHYRSFRRIDAARAP